MTLFIYLLLTIIFGYLLINLLKNKETFLSKLSLGFLLGNGINVFYIFLIGFCNITYSVKILFILLLVLILIVLLLNLVFKRIKKVNINISKENIRPIDYVVYFSFGVICVWNIYRNLSWPVTDWDAIALYDARAKFIIYSGNNLIDVFKSLTSYHFSYPLLTSLSHYYVYLFGNNYPLIIYSLYYIFFVVLFFSLLKKITNRNISIIFSLLVAINFQFITHSIMAYTNMIYSIYLIFGFIYAYIYIKNRELDNIVFSSICFGLSSFTRSEESLWVIGVLTLLTVLFVLKIKSKIKPIFILLIILLFITPWEIFKKIYSEVNTNANLTKSYLNSLINSSKLEIYRQSLGYYWRGIIKDNIIVFIPFITSLLLKNGLNPEKIYQIINVLIMNIFLFVGVLMLGLHFSNYHWWSLLGSFQRMTIFIVPLVFFYTADNIYIASSGKVIKDIHK